MVLKFWMLEIWYFLSFRYWFLNFECWKCCCDWKLNLHFTNMSCFVTILKWFIFWMFSFLYCLALIVEILLNWLLLMKLLDYQIFPFFLKTKIILSILSLILTVKKWWTYNICLAFLINASLFMECCNKFLIMFLYEKRIWKNQRRNN